jgi:hypothetical protein
MRRVRAALAVAAAASALVSVGCRSSAGPSEGGTASTSSAAGLASSQPLAHVGDRTITLGDFVASLEHMDQFDRLRYQAPDRRRELLAEMVDVALLADEARARGYDQEPQTQQALREILRDAMLKTAREGAPTPSDIAESEVRAYYDAHRDEFRDPERRRVSAIVLPNAGAAAAVLPAASKASPTQWGEIVRARSTDPHAKDDVPLDLAGDLGFVSPPGDPRGTNARVPEEVRAAVFGASRVGEVVARAVPAGGAFYVVKFASKSDARERSLDDASRAIRVKLAQDKIHDREAALLDELRKKYPVQIDEAALAQVKVGAASETDGGRAAANENDGGR